MNLAEFPKRDDGSFYQCRVPACSAPARRYIMVGTATGLDVVRYFCDEHEVIRTYG